jgi:hypothetical protein
MPGNTGTRHTELSAEDVVMNLTDANAIFNAERRSISCRQ